MLAVVVSHLASAWTLQRTPAVRAAAVETVPVTVQMVDVPAPPAPAADAPPAPPTPSRETRLRPPAPQPSRAPTLVPPPLPEPAADAITAPAPHPAEPAPAAAPAPSPPPGSAAPAMSTDMPAPPPPSAQRKVVDATAVGYLRLPPVEVPRLSRRAGESGTVWLRVFVDVRGMPVQVSVQRSSGHARLDEQALFAMRQARFNPQTENGLPVELEVTAPIEYTLE